MPKTQSQAVPKGWMAGGSNSRDYKINICESTCHSGTRCAELLSKSEAASGFETLMQFIDATKFRGKRVRFSAYVKCQGVEQWAGLWMRIDVGSEIVAFDNMQDRPFSGDEDWQKYDVVLNVPEASTKISFGILLNGCGHVWIDDCELAEASASDRITGNLNRSCGVRYQNDHATNLDFRKGLNTKSTDSCLQLMPVGWFAQQSSPGTYSMGAAKLNAKAPQSAAFIQSNDSAQSNNWGALLQSVRADEFVGKRARLKGWLKTTDVKGTTGLWLRADAGTQLSVCYDYMEDRPVEGTTDWIEYACVIEVPAETDNIYFGVVLNGEGEVWFRDFELEAVANDVATTGPHAFRVQKEIKPKNSNSEPINLDFSETSDSAPGDRSAPSGWLLTGSQPECYKASLDTASNFEGKNCALLESIRDIKGGFGTLMQNIMPSYFLNNSVRIRARIKTQNVNWVGLWLRVDGAGGECIAFDNMHDRPIKGTTDWNEYECTLEVADAATNIAFGILQCDTGKTWLADVKIDRLESNSAAGKKITLVQKSEPVNMDFEG